MALIRPSFAAITATAAAAAAPLAIWAGAIALVAQLGCFPDPDKIRDQVPSVGTGSGGGTVAGSGGTTAVTGSGGAVATGTGGGTVAGSGGTTVVTGSGGAVVAGTGGRAAGSGGSVGSGGGTTAGSGGAVVTGTGGRAAGSGGAGGGQCTDPMYPQRCPALADVPAGCWPATTNCSTVKNCNGSYIGCRTASEQVDCSAPPDTRCKTCPDPMYPKLCPALGLVPTKCWTAATDCSTVTMCTDGSSWACSTGYLYDCATSRCLAAMRWSFTHACATAGDIGVRLFDTTSILVWPPTLANVYVLPPAMTRFVDIACIPGDQICYGAGTDTLYWGLGLDGDQLCDTCCNTCAPGNATPRTLNCTP